MHACLLSDLCYPKADAITRRGIVELMFRELSEAHRYDDVWFCTAIMEC